MPEDLRQLHAAQLEKPMKDILWTVTFFGRLANDTEPVATDISTTKPVKVIPPNFNVSTLAWTLREGSEEDKVRALLGLHERMWHARGKKFYDMLNRLMVPKSAIDLVEKALSHCVECRKWEIPKNLPRFSAELSGFFNELLMMDLFFCWDKIWLMILDDAVKYRITSPLKSKTGKDIFKALLKDWIRYFGPPRSIISDQEGGIKSEDFALVCERFSIYRRLAGSTAKKLEEHTRTGAVERAIALTKLTMFKVRADAIREGWQVDDEDIAYEATMAGNTSLEYGGITPAQCVLGQNPRGMYEMDCEAVVAHEGALAQSPDVFESYLRMRLYSKLRMQESVIEYRLAQAQNRASQKVSLGDLIPLVTPVDLFRVPQHKGESGWRGPCKLLDISPNDNCATVQHQSVPYMVPLRHVRLHIGYAVYSEFSQLDWHSYYQDTTIYAAGQPQTIPTGASDVLALMDIVDGTTPGKTHTVGKLLCEDSWLCFPEGLESDPPKIWTLVKKCAPMFLGNLSFDGIVYGTQCKRFPALPTGTGDGLLVFWPRARRENYFMQMVPTNGIIHLENLLQQEWFSHSALLFYCHAWTTEQDANAVPNNISDISMIPHIDEDLTFDDFFPSSDQPSRTTNPTTDVTIRDPTLSLSDSTMQVPTVPDDSFSRSRSRNRTDLSQTNPTDDSPTAPIPPTRPTPQIVDRFDRSRSRDDPSYDASRSRDDSSQAPSNDDPSSWDRSRSRNHQDGGPSLPPSEQAPAEPTNSDETWERSRTRHGSRVASTIIDRSCSQTLPESNTTISVDPNVTTSTARGSAVTVEQPSDATIQYPSNLYPDSVEEEIARIEAANDPTLDEPSIGNSLPTIEYSDDEVEGFSNTFWNTNENTTKMHEALHGLDAASAGSLRQNLLTDEAFNPTDVLLANIHAFTTDIARICNASGSATNLPWSKEDSTMVWHSKAVNADACFWIDLHTCEILKVDEDTDNLTDDDLALYPEMVEAADLKEVQQFVDQEAFRCRFRTAVPFDVKAIDGVWIRKWKKGSDGTWALKSRMCVRGFLDSQRDQLATRSTTATRLSQRLVISFSVIFGMEFESWDVSGAFLKGLNFKELTIALRKKGISVPERKVFLAPPPNVWRLFHRCTNCDIKIDLTKHSTYILEVLRCVYGLNDAPLAWQLCLEEFLLETVEMTQSLFDDSFFFRMSSPGIPDLLLSTHVDDNGAAGLPPVMDATHQLFVDAFGKTTRDKLPFTHTGVRCSRLKTGGIKQDQDEYCQKLKPYVIETHRRSADSEPLTPTELTGYRGLVGGLLWLCQTRVDLLADTILAAGEVTRTTVAHLKMANSMIAKAKKYRENVGLYFQPLCPPYCLHVPHDATGASKEKSYAQEGAMILLGGDRSDQYHLAKDGHVQNFTALGGFFHPLVICSKKSKRVSSSTSSSETNACVTAKELAQLCALRLTEILGGGILWPISSFPTVGTFIDLQDLALSMVPTDQYTDCNDLFELATNLKGAPQDRNQRLYITSIRDDRVRHRIRHFIKIPTEYMLADPLTKVMISSGLYEYLTSGFWLLKPTQTKGIILRRSVKIPIGTPLSDEVLHEPLTTCPRKPPTVCQHFVIADNADDGNCSDALGPETSLVPGRSTTHEKNNRRGSGSYWRPCRKRPRRERRESPNDDEDDDPEDEPEHDEPTHHPTPKKQCQDFSVSREQCEIASIDEGLICEWIACAQPRCREVPDVPPPRNEPPAWLEPPDGSETSTEAEEVYLPPQPKWKAKSKQLLRQLPFAKQRPRMKAPKKTPTHKTKPPTQQFVEVHAEALQEVATRVERDWFEQWLSDEELWNDLHDMD